MISPRKYYNLYLQLAHLYHKGEAVTKDCKKAFRHLTTFLNEQSTWLEDVYSAVNALDSGMSLQYCILPPVTSYC